MAKRVRVPGLLIMKQKGEKITALTAYDFTLARLLDTAGVDIILVGDSLGTIVQGNETTLSVTLDEMIYHCRAVVRGVKRALVVADMPFMSYQLGPEQALSAAGRAVKEAGVAAVKLEGGISISKSIERIVQAGIPVMGHVGLQPQSYHQMGGYRVQGGTEDSAKRVLEDALSVEQAGAFSVVLEGIPGELSSQITSQLNIPTIGIGAGEHCSGQILVTHDLLGMTHLEPEADPKFVKRYAELGREAVEAVRHFREDVRDGRFPEEDNTYSSSVSQPSCAKSLSTTAGRVH